MEHSHEGGSIPVRKDIVNVAPHFSLCSEERHNSDIFQLLKNVMFEIILLSK